MFRAIFLLLFSGCAYTEVRDRNGNLMFKTMADAQNISYSGPGYSFSAQSLNHSVPTSAGGRASSQIIKSSADVVGEIGTHMTVPKFIK